MKRQGCRLYPLGDCNPACRIPLRSETGIGLPSKLGDALLSAMALDNVFSLSYSIQQLILVKPAFQMFVSESAAEIRVARPSRSSLPRMRTRPSECRSSPVHYR